MDDVAIDHRRTVSPVTSGPGWNIFAGPGGPPQRSADHFVASPFTRLARVQATQIAGDALIALALANSLFFSIDPQAARWRVALYLLLTMAPFAVVSPLIGPAIDRAGGGRKWTIVAPQPPSCSPASAKETTSGCLVNSA